MVCVCVCVGGGGEGGGGGVTPQSLVLEKCVFLQEALPWRKHLSSFFSTTPPLFQFFTGPNNMIVILCK